MIFSSASMSTLTADGEQRLYRCNKKFNNKGFTLIELIVIIALIVLASGIVIGFISSAMNKNAEIDEKSRSMYYSIQSLMSNIKNSAALPKNSDGGISLVTRDNSPFSTSGKNYYFEIGVKSGQVDSFRFMVCAAGDFENALNSNTNYGDNIGNYFSQSQLPLSDIHEINDTAWKRLKARIEPFVENDENDGYYIVYVDNNYRVDRVYYTPESTLFSTIIGKQFSADGYIEDIGNIGVFPLSKGAKGVVVTGSTG